MDAANGVADVLVGSRGHGAGVQDYQFRIAG
jgi:hypothetical protein